MVELRWLKEAKDDLREIYAYISRDSRRYAKLQVDRLYERAQIIKTQRWTGKMVEEISDPTIREVITGNYRIIYRIKDEKSVDVLMVHHSARDLNKRIRRKNL